MRPSGQNRSGLAAASVFAAVLFSVASWAEAAYIEEADGLIKRGLYAEAIARLDADLTSRPDDLDLLLRKGICQSMLDHFDEARQTFQRGLSINPREPRFLHNLGLLCMREKKFDEAERYFNETLAVRPWHPETNYHLGVIYEGRGDIAKAAEYYMRELNQNARCAKAWQRWHVLKSTRLADGPAKGGISLTVVLFAVSATAVGLFVLFWQKN